jgi:hypothetical protein
VARREEVLQRCDGKGGKAPGDLFMRWKGKNQGRGEGKASRYRSTTESGEPSFFFIWQVKYSKLLEMTSFQLGK